MRIYDTGKTTWLEQSISCHASVIMVSDKTCRTLLNRIGRDKFPGCLLTALNNTHTDVVLNIVAGFNRLFIGLEICVSFSFTISTSSS